MASVCVYRVTAHVRHDDGHEKSSRCVSTDIYTRVYSTVVIVLGPHAYFRVFVLRRAATPRPHPLYTRLLIFQKTTVVYYYCRCIIYTHTHTLCVRYVYAYNIYIMFTVELIAKSSPRAPYVDDGRLHPRCFACCSDNRVSPIKLRRNTCVIVVL